MSAHQSSIPDPSFPAPRRSLLVLNALALLLVAIGFRCWSLGNIPGVNGDEAWYGVQAWLALHGGAEGGWHTPTGNPLNPLFFGPLALLHLWFPLSFSLLRSVAVAGGLAALVINWLFCRWVFDRRTALISTVLLAILPINIAYGRFAWDASQSLAATLPVVYLALAAIRFPARFDRWITASILALAIAIWVHPTNIFIATIVGVAWLAHCRPNQLPSPDQPSVGARKGAGGEGNCGGKTSSSVWCLAVLLVAALLLAVWACTAQPSRGPLAQRMAQRWGDARELSQPDDLPPASVLLARLFTGGTVYRYIPGSRSWFEWPLPAELDGWGLDVGLFWAGLIGAAWLLWRSWRLRHNSCVLSGTADGVLLAAWLLQIVGFLVVGGPRAMAPGQERFAICLIGPTVLLGSRGAALAWEAASPRWRVALATATLAGWLVLADFEVHYFRSIEQTGGQTHLTFRTGAVEPKQAALAYILEQSAANHGQSESPQTWIVCSQWWNYWPIRYLAMSHRDVSVARTTEIADSDDYRRALAEGRVWFVEFCDTEPQRQVESQLATRTPSRQEFRDYGGRPVLCVLHAPAQ
jgi:hypothetical protein